MKEPDYKHILEMVCSSLEGWIHGAVYDNKRREPERIAAFAQVARYISNELIRTGHPRHSLMNAMDNAFELAKDIG